MKSSNIRNYSSWIVLAYDIGAVIIAWLAAYVVRYNLSLDIPWFMVLNGLRVLPVLVMIHLVFYRVFSTYRPLWRFSSLPELVRLCKALICAWFISLSVFWFLGDLLGIPRSIWAIYPLLLIMILIFGRLVIRYINSRTKGQVVAAKRTLIIGAGQGAEMFLRDLEQWQEKQYKPIVMLDDNRKLQGKEIRGIPIVGSTTLILDMIRKHRIELVIIAIPSINSAALKPMLLACEEAKIPVRILPSLEGITGGHISVSDLREVSLEDLLGRDPVKLDHEITQHFLKDQVVLVTGGAGSIGSELCRQIMRAGVKQLIIADQSEFSLYCIDQEFKNTGIHHFQTVLLDVTDTIAVKHLLATHQPAIIFHAAAYKHVPMLESQLREAIKNNVLGAKVLAEAAVAHQVKKFIMVSTDKAVNPTNVMGATKRIAELFCQGCNAQFPNATRFITVRFGNVFGSAGSVIPLFKQQLAKGGPITVTHPDITRYFMTIPEASQLVLQAGAMGEGGEIFVLDMGEPVKIVDLAKQLIKLSGKTEENIKIAYTGLRPGEKLYEELFYGSEKLIATTQQKIFRANGVELKREWDVIETAFAAFEQGCMTYDQALLLEALKTLLANEAAGLFDAK
jgi:FlaA1/EpsC-like NDP-sugar epimerase